jgi:hypothetical protein
MHSVRFDRECHVDAIVHEQQGSGLLGDRAQLGSDLE